jgi:hypothetical protein
MFFPEFSEVDGLSLVWRLAFGVFSCVFTLFFLLAPVELSRGCDWCVVMFLSVLEGLSSVVRSMSVVCVMFGV